MKHLTIGTAGHVDHGKTALIRALTGQETDRLPEEKARGISIDIGFAQFMLPSGRRAGVVDVPGHERFVKNMLAGVTGIDLVLLVVAADEGVMPQTIEHLNILRLLEVKKGLVVLTKKDLVDPDWLELVREDVRGALKGTFLEKAPALSVSSVTGEGLPELRETLDLMLAQTEARDSSAFPRLPIDRVFISPGFGTVVTGTLAAGIIGVDQRIEILPQGLEVRVRGLQVHGEKVDQAEAGQRVAVNLVGVEKSDLRRGNVLTQPGALTPTQALAGLLSMVPGDFPRLKTGARVHLHTGTAEVLARVVLLDREEIGPGDQGYALFRTEEPVVAGRRDRFIIRSYSPMHTVGGGIVIEPHARYRRFNPQSLEELRTKERGTPEELVASALASLKGTAGPGDLVGAVSLPVDSIRQELIALAARGEVIELAPDLYIHRRSVLSFQAEVESFFEDYYRGHPLRWGAPREELRKRLLPKADPKAFNALLAVMIAKGLIQTERDRVAPGGRRIEFTPAQAKFREQLVERIRLGGFSPPSVREAKEGIEVKGTPTEEILASLIEEGILVKITDDFCLHRDYFEKSRHLVIEFFKEKSTLSMAEFRDLLGTSRKYAVPLLEYLDSTKVTRRVGDDRIRV